VNYEDFQHVYMRDLCVWAQGGLRSYLPSQHFLIKEIKGHMSNVAKKDN